MRSPNFDTRGGVEVSMLVLHYTGMKSAEEALARLCDAASKVSAHYVVDEDGRVHSLVDEAQRAWHAGVASWRGKTRINAASIGIEIVNPGHEFGYRAFPEKQIEAVSNLCREILARHTIPARNVVGHSDVAPTRKEDPGELFPWAWLAAQGIGLWPSYIDEKPVSADWPQKLAKYGYDMADETAAARAFQRHFRTTKIDGAWDAECQGRLESLLAML